MTRSLVDVKSEVDAADTLLTAAIADGVLAFVDSPGNQAIVNWRSYRIAEWSRQLPATEQDRVPSVDWVALVRLRVLLAHHFHTIKPELMFVYAAMQVPKLQHALGRVDNT